MVGRTSIPTEIEREILVECGHRCAVCGSPLSLELARIIHWHKSREHKAEDLICLCASCHEQADKENWGERTLKEYKQNPWVIRVVSHNKDIWSKEKEVLLRTHHSWFVAYQEGKRIALEPSLDRLVATLNEKLGVPRKPCEFHEIIEKPAFRRGPSPRLKPTKS